MATKVKPVPFKTPKGLLQWVTHSGEGKENLSGKFKYQADVIIAADAPEAKKLKKQLDDFWKDNKPAGYRGARKTSGYKVEEKPVLDADGNKQYVENEDGDEVLLKEKTGNLVFTFSTDTTFPSGDPKVVKIYNAKGNPVNLGDKKIGNGSEGNISGAMGIYDREDGKGVTLYLNSIRIIKFVEFTDVEQWDDAGEDEGWTGDNNWDAEDQPETDQSAKGAPRL